MASRLDDVCNTLITAITAAINTAGIPGSVLDVTTESGSQRQITVAGGNVYKGFPEGPELAKLLKTGDGKWAITVTPQNPHATTRYSPDDQPIFKPPAQTLFATVSDATITFSGTAGACNVHTVINKVGDARVPVTAGQSLSAIATAVAAAIVALNISGVSASAAGAVVTVTGAFLLKCNVSGTGILMREVARVSRVMQVSIWASDPYTRAALEDPLIAYVGDAITPFLTLSDGTDMYVTYNGDGWIDDSQGTYSLLVAHHCIEVEYGIMQSTPVAQLGAVENLVTPRNGAPVTVYVG